jgi:uncharacterized protein YdhG (YjbR/CyaY superfamily)
MNNNIRPNVIIKKYPCIYMGLEEIYKNLTYFDYYSSSVLLFILITILTILACLYFRLMTNIEPIKNDWANNRCRPHIIPFAGLINKNDNESATTATFNNFNYCTQKILSDSAGKHVQPLEYIIQMFSGMVKNISKDLNNARAMIDRIRTDLANVINEIMYRFINIIVPIQQIVLAFKDTMAKIQGVLTSGVYTIMSSYYAIKSLLGAVATMLIQTLIAGAAMIIIMWILPFTWPAAVAGTTILVAMSVMVAVFLTFLVQIFKIRPKLGLPGIPSKPLCFDKDAPIEMSDGSIKKISEIRIGDLLKDNNKVTATLKVNASGVKMYNLNSVIVSDTHSVLYKDKWILASEHPHALSVSCYDEKFLYCLNTTKKTIEINNMTFIDWDEIYDEVRKRIMRNHSIHKNHDYHDKLDGGFTGDSMITMSDGTMKTIIDIQIGDILKNNSVVDGVVEIECPELQFTYYLGKNRKIDGGPNLKFKDSTDVLIKKQTKRSERLYHLLTSSGTFECNNTIIYDYNACIDHS